MSDGDEKREISVHGKNSLKLAGARTDLNVYQKLLSLMDYIMFGILFYA